MSGLTTSYILNELKKAKIPFCVWKNLHEIDLMIEGETDIDLHLPLPHKSAFANFCQSIDGIKVDFRRQSIPGVQHIYFLDKNGKIIHFHVYFALFTGESHIKDYLLPISDLMIKTRVPDPHLGFVASYEIESLLTTLRLYLKRSSLIGALLYLRENKDYEIQKSRISDQVVLPECLPKFGLSYAYFLSRRLKNENFLGFYVFGKILRFNIRTFRRYGQVQAIYESLKVIFRHVLNRFTIKERKTLANYGRFIVITGPDGAGKTTVLEALANRFGGKLTVKTVHFGRPPANLATALVHFALIIRRHLKRRSVETPFSENIPQSTGLIACLRYVALAYDRNRLSNLVLKYLSRGYIVFSDRYPSKDIGKMDSPQIILTDRNSFLKQSLAQIEKNFYNQIITPDLLIEFKVSETEAIIRNKSRDKKHKESDQEIMHRMKSNSNLHYECSQYLEFHNNSSVEHAVKHLCKKIWKILV